MVNRLHNPSFLAYAKLFGGHGIRVTKVDQLRQALDESLSRQGPSLVEIITDADLNIARWASGGNSIVPAAGPVLV